MGELELLGHGEDFDGVAYEDYLGYAVGNDSVGGCKCAGFSSFRKYYPLGIGLCVGRKLFKECHGERVLIYPVSGKIQVNYYRKITFKR